MLDASGNEVPALVDDRINPGSGAVSRIVRVQNLGTHPMFVRVMLSVEGVRPNGDALSLDHAVTYDFGDASAWQRGQDGRYYLAVALEPDQTTPVLIDSFEVEAGALAGIDQLKLVIKADGVQSEHNATSSLTAEGWQHDEYSGFDMAESAAHGAGACFGRDRGALRRTRQGACRLGR